MSKPKNIQNKDKYDEDEARQRHTPPNNPAEGGYQNADKQKNPK